MRRPQPLLLALALVGLASVAAAERPNAMRLYPSRTVFFVRTPAAGELLGKITESEFFQDPEIKPFLDALFGKIDTAYRDNAPGEVTGGGLGDLLAFFRGEVAFGVTPRTNEAPAVLLLADTLSEADREANDPLVVGEARDRVANLLASIEAKARAEGSGVGREPVGSVEALVVRPYNPNRVAGVVERDGVVLVSNDKVLLESVISKWDEAEGLPTLVAEPTDDDGAAGDEDRAKRVERLRRRYAAPLADNTAFTEAIRECVEERIGGGDDAPPNVTGFIDPVGIFRAVAQRNAGMRVALATLPILGLDGVEGAAAAGWVDYGDWDALFRAHLLLDNPRAGVLKMARLTPVDTTPGDCVPTEITEYLCGGVNLAATLDGAGQLYDRIRGEGEFAKLTQERVTERIGVSPDEIVEHLTGRMVSVQAYGETPEGQAPRVTPSRAVLVTVTDPEWARAAIDKVVKRLEVRAEWEDRAGVPLLQYIDLGPATWSADATQEDRRRRARLEAQGMMTCLALVDDQLIFAQTRELLEKLIDTHAGEYDRLVDHLPFRLTASRAGRLGRGLVGTEEGRVLTYSDPMAQFKQWHAAGESDAAREQLERMAEFAPPMRWLRDTLDEVGVPSVEALTKYAGPSGGALFDTPRGFRFVGFSFKLQTE